MRAVQINFADDKIDIPVPGKIKGTQTQPRYIEEQDHVTRWILEGSVDGEHFEVLEDKSQAETDLPHDLVVMEAGKQIRYVKLNILEIPYDQNHVSQDYVYSVSGKVRNQKCQNSRQYAKVMWI